MMRPTAILLLFLAANCCSAAVPMGRRVLQDGSADDAPLDTKHIHPLANVPVDTIGVASEDEADLNAAVVAAPCGNDNGISYHGGPVMTVRVVRARASTRRMRTE